MNVKTDKLISVIIPTFNRTSTIKRAINSVLSQTYSNFEIIIIDDGSNDIDLLESIITNYNNKKIIFKKNTKNLNGAVSRNIGIELSKGEYIAFLDSDDEWDSTKLEKQIKLASLQKNENFLIYTKSKRYGKKFVEILPSRVKKKNEPISDYLFVNDGYMPTPSFFVPSKVIRKINFNPKLKRHQDYDLLLRLESYGIEFLMVDDILVSIHSDPNSKSEQRGASYERSQYFLDNYKKYFTLRAYNSFWLKNVAFYMSRDKKKIKALKELFFQKRFKGVRKKTFFVYLIYIVSVDTKFYKLLEKMYILMSRK